MFFLEDAIVLARYLAEAFSLRKSEELEVLEEEEYKKIKTSLKKYSNDEKWNRYMVFHHGGLCRRIRLLKTSTPYQWNRPKTKVLIGSALCGGKVVRIQETIIVRKIDYKGLCILRENP